MFEKDILKLDRFSENANIDYNVCYNRGYYNIPLYDQYHITIPQHCIDNSNMFIMKMNCNSFYVWYKDADETIYLFKPNGGWDKKMLNCFYNRTIYPRDIPSFEDKLIEIDSYLNRLDVDDIINSFSIENVEFCDSRVGRDDYYYITKTYKVLEEEYINSLFPHKDVIIYSDHGYTSAESMRIEFEVKAYSDEERDLKLSARHRYDKNSHRRFLIKKAYNDIYPLLYDLIGNTEYIRSNKIGH